jgi:hypothetical protein
MRSAALHEELRALEGDVQQTGTQAQLLLERALQALARGDLVTGEFREFTDASHPEIEHPELLEGGGSPD